MKGRRFIYILLGGAFCLSFVHSIYILLFSLASPHKTHPFQYSFSWFYCILAKVFRSNRITLLSLSLSFFGLCSTCICYLHGLSLWFKTQYQISFSVFILFPLHLKFYLLSFISLLSFTVCVAGLCCNAPEEDWWKMHFVL